MASFPIPSPPGESGRRPICLRRTALATTFPAPQWDRRVTGIARHVDDRFVAARVVEAIGDEVMHALPAHVGEVHRRAGRMVGGSLDDLVGAGEQRVWHRQTEFFGRF
jgi:hypothetical protein